ncbi:MAG TPA: hypothetical protein VN828_02660, partial [Acidobacteriaceae bacterium]|nr:hypothetical protein [Acidobacteriaceae bacterium]
GCGSMALQAADLWLCRLRIYGFTGCGSMALQAADLSLCRLRIYGFAGCGFQALQAADFRLWNRPFFRLAESIQAAGT